MTLKARIEITTGRVALLVILVVVLQNVLVSELHAHSGNSGVRVDQQTVVTLDDDGLTVIYTTQLNRPGAFLEFTRMDTNGDGTPSSEEQARYFAEQAKKLPAGLELIVGGKLVAMVPTGEVELSMPFQKLYRFRAAHPPDWEHGAVVELHNDNYLDFPGAIIVTLEPGDGADITYDSRWARDAASEAELIGLVDPKQRDVVFRYARGTGRVDPPDDWGPDSTEPTSPLFLVNGDVEHGDGSETNALFSGFSRKTALLGAAGAFGVVVLIAWLVVVARRIRAVRRDSNSVWMPEFPDDTASRSWFWRPPSSALVVGTVLVVAVCLIGWRYVASRDARARQVAVPDPLEAARIFQDLHRKIYQAFEARTESDIYDTLAEGLSGEVLDEVYNEVYEALRIRAGGTARFDVRRVKPIATEILPAADRRVPGYQVRYRWRVYGTVTHFSHTHARFNEYEALYRVEYQEDTWRIVGSEVRQNKRVTLGRT